MTTIEAFVKELTETQGKMLCTWCPMCGRSARRVRVTSVEHETRYNRQLKTQHFTCAIGCVCLCGCAFSLKIAKDEKHD